MATTPVNTNAGPNSTALLDKLVALAAVPKHLTGANIGFLDLQTQSPLGGEFAQYRLLTGKTPAVASLNAAAAGGSTTSPPMPLTYDPWGNLIPALGPFSPSGWGPYITEAMIGHGQRGGVVVVTDGMLSNPCVFANGSTKAGFTLSIATINGSGTPAAPTGAVGVASTGPYNPAGGVMVGRFTNASGKAVLHWGLYSGIGASELTGVWFCPIGFAPGVNTTVTAGSNLAASTIPLASVPWGVESGTLQVYNDAGVLQTITFDAVDTVNRALVGCAGGTGTCSTRVPATIVSSWSIEAAYQGSSVDTIASTNGLSIAGRSPFSGAGLPAGALTGAWPLQWDSTAYTTLGLGSSSDYNSAQVLLANPSLNAQLDYLAQFFYELAQHDIPVIFRNLTEQNNGGGAWWAYSAPRSVTWYSSLWKYCVGYLTGTNGFAGQPTCLSYSGLPLVTEVLFESCQVGAGTWLRVATDPNGCPIDPTNSTVLCDTVGPDYYSTAATDLDAVSSACNTDYPRVPKRIPEFYGQTTSNPSPQVPFTGPTQDLSLGGSLVTTGTVSNGPFTAGGGTVTVQTTNGPQSVPFTSAATVTGTTTITLGSVAGIPVGSYVVVGSSIVQKDASCATGATMAGWMDALTQCCGFATWDTQRPGPSSLGQIGQPGAAGLFTDADSLNLEDINPPLPWAARSGLIMAAG